MMLLENIVAPQCRNRLWRCFLGLLCVSVSLAYVFHHLLWLRENQWNWRDTIFITSFRAYDSNHYLSQIRDIYDGNYRLSNAFIAEYKQTARPLWPVFPLYFAAFAGKLLRLKVQHLMVVMDAVLPPLIFLLTYRLLTIISGARRASALGAFVLVTLPHLARLSDAQRLGRAIMDIATTGSVAGLVPALWHVHAYHDGFARPINPSLTICFLLAALICFLKTITTFRWRDLALTIAFGLATSYSYVYFSSVLYAFWGVFALFSALFRQRRSCKLTMMALAGTLIGSAPFWFSAFRFSDSALHQAILMTRTHAPMITPQVIFMLALAVVFASLLKTGLGRQLPGLTALAMLLGAVGALNHRVVTGVEVQSWHYDTHVLPQMTLLALILLITELGRGRVSFWRMPALPARGLLFVIGAAGILTSLFATPALVARYFSPDNTLSSQAHAALRIMRGAAGITGGACFTGGIALRALFQDRAVSAGRLLYLFAFLPPLLSVAAVQYQLYYGFLRPQLAYNQRLAPALRWLDARTEKESVVVCGLNYQTPHVVVPIYAHNNVYTDPLMSVYPVPPLSEVRDRMYNVMALMGVTTRHEFERYMASEHLGAKFEEYQRKLNKDLHAELKTYRADYLFYGPREQASFHVKPERYPFLTPAYSDSAVTIYRIRQ